jgi:hypothetical protein
VEGVVADSINGDQSYEREREIEQILVSSMDPISKVKRLMALGLEEDEAEEMVDNYQLGLAAPTYYERLDFDR